MTPVQSSNLAAVGYGYDGVLTIRFRSGGVYQYYSVPHERYIGLMNAESKGRYFHSYIKRVFRYRRV